MRAPPSPNFNGLPAETDLETLKAKLAKPAFRDLLSDLNRQVDEAIEADSSTGQLVSRPWCHSQYVTPSVLEAGFLHFIAGKPETAEHVARQTAKLRRLYADPPMSFKRELPSFHGKPTAYFSNALTALAVRLCAQSLPKESYADFLQLMRSRLLDDCHNPEYLLTHFNAGHNAVVTHLIAIAVCALIFGHECGHPDTEAIIERGLNACLAHLRWGFDEKGSPHEGQMYACVTLEWVFLFADLLKRHNGCDLFALRQDRFNAILDANINLQLPGFIGIIGFDDSRDLIAAHPMPWLPLTARVLNRPQDLALWRQIKNNRASNRPWRWSANWLATFELLWWSGNEPEKPIQSYNLPLCHVGMGKALAQFRTSWAENATCVTLLGQGRSRNVPDHTHGDAGHFSIFTNGELLAYDTAYFNFDEDTHSVVMIDGRPFSRTKQGNLYSGRFASFRQTPILDYIEVDAAAAKGCIWAQRHFLFVRAENQLCYLAALDNINKDNGKHNFVWQLQAHPDTTVRINTERTAEILGKNARLDCRFFNPLPDDYPSFPHRLTISSAPHPHINPASGEPATNPRLIAEQQGWNCTLMALIVPRKTNEPPLVVHDATTSRTFNVFIEHGEFVDQLVYACDHSLVRLKNLWADSEIVLVRRNRAGQATAAWTSDGGPVRTDPA